MYMRKNLFFTWEKSRKRNPKKIQKNADEYEEKDFKG